MNDERIERAARNNAAWCDAVCRAHGRPGELLDDVWINRHETPPFYPNAVTLTRAETAQLPHVRALCGDGLPTGWAVKDSFHLLHLEQLGFAPLFVAEWLWRRDSLPIPPAARTNVQWSRVVDPGDLTAWEAAWRDDDLAPTPVLPQVFMPELLVNPRVAIFAARQNGAIIAGAIANHSDDVVGISNVFVRGEDVMNPWGECLAAAIDAFPQLPVVGYATGAELLIAERFGFERIGPLRVWTRQPA